MTIKAELVKTLEDNNFQTKRVFKLSSPVSFIDWTNFDDDDAVRDANFVLVSRVVATDHGNWETMIFPADKEGSVENWGDLWSVRGWEHMGTTVDNFMETVNERADRQRISS